MIEEGDRIPPVDITIVTPDDRETLSADQLFSGKKVVLFGVPGAFTPTCSASHLPGFVALADQIKTRGVDMIACVSINDVFVMRAWGEQQNAEAITLLADLGGEFTDAVGLEVVGQAGRSLVELCVRQRHVACIERHTVGDRVRHRLEDVGELDVACGHVAEPLSV